VLIDWFTVIAQIVNFLILLLLLRRFLYRPILNAMRTRERRITEQLESAEKKRMEAEAEKEEYRAQNEELREFYEQKQAEALQDVQSWRTQALKDAHHEVEELLAGWRKSIEQEKQSFTTELRRFSVQQAYAVSRKSLQDLADISLEERMQEYFLARLQKGDINLEHFKTLSNDGFTLRSAFEIPTDRQKKIEDALRAQLGSDLVLQFEVYPDILSGLELVAPDGYQAAWNLKRYLDALEIELDNQLARTGVEAQG
jgi:F-type H+-transporting ATPase subunit b